MEPAVVAKHLAGRGLVLVVAGEHGVAPDQHLAVLRDPQLGARQRLADGAEAKRIAAVSGRARRALGEPVRLEDEHVEHVKELDHLARERRSARDPDAEARTEPILDLGIDEPVRKAVLNGERPRHRSARLPELAHAPSDA